MWKLLHKGGVTFHRNSKSFPFFSLCVHNIKCVRRLDTSPAHYGMCSVRERIHEVEICLLCCLPSSSYSITVVFLKNKGQKCVQLHGFDFQL